MSKINPDLHMHSTFSDGVLTPAQLVEHAVSCGVTALAVTDHDTFAGADTLRGMTTPIPVVQGVELSLSDFHELHLLGYGTATDTELHRVVEDLARRRVTRAQRSAEILAEMGMPLTLPPLAAGHTVGRAHLARLMTQAGYVSCMQEAFDRYLAAGRPAYVPGERLSMAEALPLMRRSGFVPVLAHPLLLGKEDHVLRMLVDSWKQQGLMGVEAYHPSAAPGRDAMLDRLARSMGLLVTGGSDYHQDHDSHGTPGCMGARWLHAAEDLQALLQTIADGHRTHTKGG